MKRTSILFLFLLGVLFSSIDAQTVSVNDAQTVAQHFWSSAQGRGELQRSPLPYSHIYLFTPTRGEGFVLVSDQRAAHPIIGYSTRELFTQPLPVQLAGWLSSRNDELDFIAKQRIATTDRIEKEWQRWMNGSKSLVGDSVAPLLVTAWTQSYPYNILCPADTNASGYGGHVVVGCVATAMSQVMRYWKYPETGTGSHSYYHNYGVLSADFGNTTYQWDSMPYRLDSSSTAGQIDAVATICYHAGVSVNMNYTPTGSGSHVISYGIEDLPCAESALKTYFRYSPDLIGTMRLYYTDDSAWIALLEREISDGRPIIASGVDDSLHAGHAYVFDGFDNEDNIHVNWGWHGHGDGFYNVNSMSPLSYNFNSSETALIGIEPMGRLRISQREFIIDASAQDISFDVFSSIIDSNDWHIVSLPEWINATPVSGLGGGDTTHVVLSVMENTTGEARTEQIQVVDNDKCITITVTQHPCTDEAMCELTVYMYDTYGDGYQGNYLLFEDKHGCSYGKLQLENGFEGTATIRVCSDSLIVRWVEGYVSQEDGFVITNANGDTLSMHEAGEPFATQTVLTTDNPCSGQCLPPYNIHADGLGFDWVVAYEITWQGTANRYGVIIQGVDEISGNNILDTIYVDTNYLYLEAWDAPFNLSSSFLFNGTIRIFSVCDTGQTALSEESLELFFSNVGIESVNDQYFLLYPNPSNGIVNIEAEGLLSVELYNLDGRLLMQCKESIVDIKHLSKGIYLLKVNTLSGTTVRRIVKE